MHHIAGVENMDIVVTQKQICIAPFVKAEDVQYLVVEDHFPNGRPALEKAGGLGMNPGTWKHDIYRCLITIQNLKLIIS